MKNFDITKAYDKICEAEQPSRVYAYHCTNTDPEIIKKEGFNSRSDNADGFTMENQFEELYDNYLPANPCFVTKDGLWDTDAKYVLKIDITGLELYPDFGHLLDAGAYFDEPDGNGDTTFWWKGHDWDFLEPEFNGLKEYLRKTGGYLHSEKFTGLMSWSMIGTACIDGDELTPNRIVEVTKNDGKATAKLDESVYEDYNVDTMNILDEFLDDKSRGINRMQWNLIDPEQYAYALKKFVDEGPEMYRFSESVLDGWIRLIVENTKTIQIISELDGRDELNGGNVIDYYLVQEMFPKEYEEAVREYKEHAKKNKMDDVWVNTNAAMKVLDDAGFYNWAVLPDGNPADSDNGVAGVAELLENLDEDASPAEKIIAINRCMDVYHRRSDWSSAFIKGGKASLSKIADSRISIAVNFPEESR